MDWIEKITGDNFLGIYDVVLDIYKEYEISPKNIIIPLFPAMVKFPALCPMEGVNHRDNYCGIRWKAIQFLQGEGAIEKFELIEGAHRWQHNIKISVNEHNFISVYEEMGKQYEKRMMPQENQDSVEHQKDLHKKVSGLSCGPLAKDACDLRESVDKEFSEKNVFLDIPYINYEDCENELRRLLGHFGLHAVVAKDRLTSNAVLCKVCRLVKTCKYGITDISSGSNSISYEYGLMHGLGMKVCLLLRSESEKFTDIHGLEHLPYDSIKIFKITVAKWLLGNVPEVPKEKAIKYIASEEKSLRDNGDTSLKKIRVGEVPEFDIILNQDRKQLGSSSGGGRMGYNDVNLDLPFRIRNRSDVNVCLEDVEIEDKILGKGKVEKRSPLSRLPYNVDARKTEEPHLMFKFPNEVDLDMKGKDIKLRVKFQFSDRLIERELVTYIK